MKAIRVHNSGPPSALVEEEVSEPTPGEVDVVLQVFASGVGPWDALLRTGLQSLVRVVLAQRFGTRSADHDQPTTQFSLDSISKQRAFATDLSGLRAIHRGP
jgi:hypothetical protein